MGASLYVAAIRIQTMPRRRVIERASLTPGVVVVNNAQGSLQIVGLEDLVFILQRVLLDSGAQPLMLSKVVVQTLGLQQGALETLLSIHLWEGQRRPLESLSNYCWLNSSLMMLWTQPPSK